MKLSKETIQAILSAFAQHEADNPGDYLTLNRVSTLLSDSGIRLLDMTVKDAIFELCGPEWIIHDDDSPDRSLNGFRIGTRGELWLASSIDYAAIFEETLDPSLQNIDDTYHATTSSEPELVFHPPKVSSADWTGLSTRVTQQQLLDIRSQVKALCDAINQSDADQQTKENAIKRAVAVTALLEAPDVPWREVVEILNSPYLAAFLTAINLVQLIMSMAN